MLFNPMATFLFFWSGHLKLHDGEAHEEMVDNGILVVWTRNGAQIDNRYVMFYFNPTDYGTVCRLSYSKYGYQNQWFFPIEDGFDRA